MIISINIGYVSPLSSGILSKYPQIFDQFKTFNEFKQMVRETETLDILWEWADQHHIPPSHMCLYIRIDEPTEYWEWKVHLINIKEYRTKWEDLYGLWKYNTKKWPIKN